ncbi:MAG: carboxymuconolactone decarboxylase family protein [Ferruginibacter sp.]
MQRPLVYPLAAEASEELQQLILFYNETLGFCPNSVKTMHIRPEIARAFIQLNKAVMEKHGAVTSALKRLIGYISSEVAGCRYCQAHTIRAAERYHASQDQLENIWEYKTHAAFNDAERAALSFAHAASVIPNAVDDDIANTLRKHWSDGDIVEILGVISLFGFLNRWNDSMGTEIEDGAAASGNNLLSHRGWSEGKHNYPV